MKILFFGDVFGESGKKVLCKHIPRLKKDHNLDLIIANIENITKGKSISSVDYEFCKNCGIDVMTSGNHIMALSEAHDLLESKKDIIRPLNFSSFAPGKGTVIIEKNGKKIQITNLIGNTFMSSHYLNPYTEFEKIFNKEKADIHIIDFHGETTSEKIAFASNYDGQVNAVLGTHTHVPTADARILPKGTAFVTDVGMNGPDNSAIGMELDCIIYRQKTNMPCRFKVSNNPGILSAVILTVDDKTNKSLKIEQIVKYPESGVTDE